MERQNTRLKKQSGPKQ